MALQSQLKTRGDELHSLSRPWRGKPMTKRLNKVRSLDRLEGSVHRLTTQTHNEPTT
jgi:hypothetical protein